MHSRSRIEAYRTKCAVDYIDKRKMTWPEVIKLLSCSTQLSVKLSLLINIKMPTIVGIFIFISREIFMLSYV